jgi:hypothetical protein
MPTQHFHITELVQPEVLSEYGEAECWAMIPQHICDSLDKIREMYGKPISINAGLNQHCGIRADNCTVGAAHSDHKIVNPNQARAFDLHCSDLPTLRKLIYDNSQILKVFRSENQLATPTWIHISYYLDPCKAVGALVIFNP